MLTRHMTGHLGSTRYSPIHTDTIIREIEASTGYEVTDYQEAYVRKKAKQGYQRHLFRMRHPGVEVLDGVVPEIVGVNSHDCTTAYKMYVGCYRFVCENGMMTGSTFESFSQKHLKFDYAALSNWINDLGPRLTKMQTLIGRLRSHVPAMDTVKNISRRVVALKSLPRPDESEQMYKDRIEDMSMQALVPLRHDDLGHDAWSRFNVIQENVLKGLGRKVTSIDKTVQLNRVLWNEFEGLLHERDQCEHTENQH